MKKMASYLSRLKCISQLTNSCHREFSLNYCKQRCIYYAYTILENQAKSAIFYRLCGGIHINSLTTDTTQKSNMRIKNNFDPDLDEFNMAYEHVRKAVIQTNDKATNEVGIHCGKVLDYNTQDGKKNRGVAVLKTYKIISDGKTTSDGAFQACLLGWCVEMLQGFYLIYDDIMDKSLFRRGKPCWYQKPDVGLIAINDGLLLECGIYKILEMYFRKLEAYDKILHQFIQVTRYTAYGQALDMLNISLNQKPKFENFNFQKYHAIVEYKTSYYTFCLPVHLAMHLNNGIFIPECVKTIEYAYVNTVMMISNKNGKFFPDDFENTKIICLKLGLLFQIQDDYLDVFGDSKVTGKVGTDIKDGKCTWFSCWMFEHASDSRKQIMMENYGIDDPECISKVTTLYKDLLLEEKFHKCEQILSAEITNLVNNLSNESLQKVFHFLLYKINQRKK